MKHWYLYIIGILIISLIGTCFYANSETNKRLLLEEKLRNVKPELVIGKPDTVKVVKWLNNSIKVPVIVKEDSAITIDTTIKDDNGVVISLYSDDIRTEPIGVLYSFPERIETITRIDTLKVYIEKPVFLEPTFWDKAKYIGVGALVGIGVTGIYILVESK